MYGVGGSSARPCQHYRRDAFNPIFREAFPLFSRVPPWGRPAGLADSRRLQLARYHSGHRNMTVRLCSWASVVRVLHVRAGAEDASRIRRNEEKEDQARRGRWRRLLPAAAAVLRAYAAYEWNHARLQTPSTPFPKRCCRSYG